MKNGGMSWCWLTHRFVVVPLVLLVVFFLAGDAVRWHVLLPGLAWRAWLFVVALPSWLALGPGGGTAPRA